MKLASATVATLAFASLAACALLSAPESATVSAVLDKVPETVPHRDARQVTLLVLPPQAKPAYDTTQMAYSPRAYEVAYFRHYQWAETPSQMLQPLLVRTLEATGYFSAILTAPYSGRYSYALRSEIIEFTQDFTSQPPMLRLSLRLALSAQAAERPVVTTQISLREPLQEKTPYAGVVAANDAMAKALQDVARFVLENAD